MPNTSIHEFSLSAGITRATVLVFHARGKGRNDDQGKLDRMGIDMYGNAFRLYGCRKANMDCVAVASSLPMSSILKTLPKILKTGPRIMVCSPNSSNWYDC